MGHIDILLLLSVGYDISPLAIVKFEIFNMRAQVKI